MIKNRSKYEADCSHCASNFLCLPRGLATEAVIDLNNMMENFKEVSQDEHIFHSQDPMDNLYAVYSGSCKDYWLTENGNMRIDNFYLPGDIIGLESIPNRKYIFSLVAVEDTKLCIIPVTELFAMMQKYDSLMERVINISSYKMQNDLHVSIVTNASQRLADFMLNIASRLIERNKNIDLISLPMSQLDISLFLGMAHETVNRILNKFRKDKIIKIDNKKIFIINLDRLKEMGSTFSFISNQA